MRYATNEYTKLYTDQISKLTGDIEEVRTNFSIGGIGGQANMAFYIWALKDWAERSRKQAAIQQQIQGTLRRVAGVEGCSRRPRCPAPAGGLPITLVIQSVYEPSRVFEIAEEVKQRAEKTGAFYRGAEFAGLRPARGAGHDRPRPGGGAQCLAAEIGNTLGLLVGGGSVGQFDRDSNSYDIIPGAARLARQSRAAESVLRARQR